MQARGGINVLTSSVTKSHKQAEAVTPLQQVCEQSVASIKMEDSKMDDSGLGNSIGGNNIIRDSGMDFEYNRRMDESSFGGGGENI